MVPHEKWQRQETTIKANKNLRRGSLRKFIVEENELLKKSHSKEERVSSKKRVTPKRRE